MSGSGILARMPDRFAECASTVEQTAYGLPTPPVLRFTEAEKIGAELHDRWAIMLGEEPPLTREDFAWGDMVQFVIRRADQLARERNVG